MRSVRNLVVALVVAAILVGFIPSMTIAHAATATPKQPGRVASGCNEQNAYIIVFYNNYANDWPDCMFGYNTPPQTITNVSEVESLATGVWIWFKWYNGPTGKYCSMEGVNGNGPHWTPPSGITNLTQVDYGSEHSDIQCT